MQVPLGHGTVTEGRDKRKRKRCADRKHGELSDEQNLRLEGGTSTGRDKESKNSADLDALNISMSCDADHDEIEKLKAQIAMIDKELNERLGGGREVPDKEVHDKDVEEKHKKSH